MYRPVCTMQHTAGVVSNDIEAYCLRVGLHLQRYWRLVFGLEGGTHLLDMLQPAPAQHWPFIIATLRLYNYNLASHSIQAFVFGPWAVQLHQCAFQLDEQWLFEAHIHIWESGNQSAANHSRLD